MWVTKYQSYNFGDSGYELNVITFALKTSIIQYKYKSKSYAKIRNANFFNSTTLSSKYNKPWHIPKEAAEKRKSLFWYS